MENCDLIAQFTDIITAAATVVGVVFVWLGLRTWRSELHGHANFELARRVVRGVYEIRNEIRQIRNSFSSEPLDALFARLNSKASELDVSLLEAEVLWDLMLRESKQALKECLLTLRRASSPWQKSWYPAGLTESM
ncbi:MAG: hypothetical protein AAB250_05610, partial [Bdellovibrionota bacterium]